MEITEMTFEQYVEMNNQAMGQLMVVSNNMNEMIKKVKDESVKSAVDATTMIIDSLTTKLMVIEKDNEFFKSELEDTKQTLTHLKKVTYVLATDDGKMREITKLMQSSTYKYTKGKNTLADKLFHRSIVNGAYKHLYNIYQINSYKRINIDDFNEAITSIKKWFGNKGNIKRIINNELNKYVSNKHLSSEKQSMIDEFLEVIEGDINNLIS
jgi:hypothetical protein